MNEQISSPEMKMDKNDLYREELFTDRKMGSIRKLIPINGDGEDDPKRPTLFIGQAQMMTPVGAIPLSFEIDASTLEQAVENYGDAAKVAMDQAVEELKELRRQAASSIVIPEGGSGGMPGGGKIQMP